MIVALALLVFTSSEPACAAAAAASHRVAHELGDSEFYDGDSITIAEVRGPAPTMTVGDTIVVTGRYNLASAPSATLLLSVTTEKPERTSETPAQRVKLTRGSGEFKLVKKLDCAGKIHLTFYADDRHPIGGVYFGEGDWLLKKKSWRYRK